MNSNPTEKPASVAAFERAELPDMWAIPLDGVIPLSPAVSRLDVEPLPEVEPNDELLALDWSFQTMPSEGFHPQLNRRKAA